MGISFLLALYTAYSTGSAIARAEAVICFLFLTAPAAPVGPELLEASASGYRVHRKKLCVLHKTINIKLMKLTKKLPFLGNDLVHIGLEISLQKEYDLPCCERVLQRSF